MLEFPLQDAVEDAVFYGYVEVYGIGRSETT